ncbi:MAG: methylated-DNA--[protein]-cysteine S-methyltransferase, partial [Anaerolineae bacterium]|nr:methylated-DNA--[protein]-cysteine S-methyltransferase [Anaerolineae bacterium]
QTEPLVARIFAMADSNGTDQPLKLYLSGTNFQIKVWQALLQVPPGAAVSYGTVARLMGRPKAAQAIGQATAHNPISFLIPCHRVIRKVGEFGSYRWGTARKKAILGWEAARRHQLAEAA